MTAEQKKNRDNLGFAIIASRAAMAKIEHLMVCINQDMGLHIPGNPGKIGYIKYVWERTFEMWTVVHYNRICA